MNFTKIDPSLLPTVIIVGRPNVGKSALFNRLIRRREALVYNTPDNHVTRDIKEGIAKLGDLRFKVLDSAGLEMEATSGTILSRTTEMTGMVLARTQVAILLIDARDGVQPLDLEVGKWMRKHASKVHTIVAMNKSESLQERGLVNAAAGEAHSLGFGGPIQYLQILGWKWQSFMRSFDRCWKPLHFSFLMMTGIPVLFISAMEGRDRVEVMQQVVDACQKWCSRLSTARLNRWLRKVMSRHLWKDQDAQPKIKYFTQLSDTDTRFLIKSLKEDFNLGGIPICIMQRCISTKTASSNNTKNSYS